MSVFKEMICIVFTINSHASLSIVIKKNILQIFYKTTKTFKSVTGTVEFDN